MFAMLAFSGPSIVAGTDYDVPAALDPTMALRNNHFFFNEPYNLLGAYASGQAVLQARLHCPAWDVLCPNEIYPTNPTITGQNVGYVDLRTDAPQVIPLRQEIKLTVDVVGGAAGSTFYGFIWIGTPDWSRALPKSVYTFRTRATFTNPGTLLTGWQGPYELTFSQTLRGGVYAVLGASIDEIADLGFRLIFDQAPLYHGRVLRPGWKTLSSGFDDANNQQPWQGRYWGEWGRFHTFNPPKCEIFQNILGAGTDHLVLTLAYLGEDQSLLKAGVQTI
jgi:hypothetical protein